MEALFGFLNAIHPISEQGAQAFASRLKHKEVHKKSVLLKAGHICQHIYFIEKGLFRCYYLKHDAEVCSWFMKEGDVIVSVESFFRQVISYEYIQAVEDSDVYYMDYQNLQFIYRNYPEFNFIARVLTEKYYCLSEQRLYSIRMMRAAERYSFLMEHHPEFLLRVPAKFIASYLGIDETTLSKIKNPRLKPVS